MKQHHAATFLPSLGGWGTGSLWTMVFLMVVSAGCQRIPDEVEIEERRVASVVPSGDINMSPRERFGRLSDEERAAKQRRQANPAELLAYDLPSGWTRHERTEFRLINLRPAGDSRASCSVSVFGGAGGGLVDNINRWRGQFGMEPSSEEELMTLPLIKLVGGNASLVELQGTYAGMAGDGGDDWALLGAIASTPAATIFVKMTAPKTLMAEERESFFAFVASLRFSGDEEAAPAAPDEHAGHNHAPGEGHDAEEPAAPIEVAEEGDVTFAANGYRFTVPSTWSDAGPATMRTLNFRVAAEVECYLVVLGGDGGGLVPNINRWQGQMGLDALSEDEVEALPRALFLGEEAYLLQADGDFAGMDGMPRDDMTMLAMALLREDDSLFLKMIGPEDQVAVHREAFLKLASTLEEVQ